MNISDKAILVIDAATESCSAALKFDDKVYTRYEVCPQQHSQKLLPMVDELLQEAGVNLNEVDVLGFGRGPGSFTGVRIGVSVAQGLAFGAELPVTGISNLQAMAQAAIELHHADQVLSVIDARMGEVYIALFDNVNGIATLVNEELVLSPDNALESFKPLVKEGCVGVGSGWSAYPLLNETLSLKVLSDIEFPNAQFMLGLVVKMTEDNQLVSAEDAQPVYVRDTVTWKKLPGRE